MSPDAPRGSRRYFWGNTLRQALARAARYSGVAPDDLAWKPVEKRHGFVNKTRRFLIEVDPASPRRTGPAAPAAAVAKPAPPVSERPPRTPEPRPVPPRAPAAPAPAERPSLPVAQLSPARMPERSTPPEPPMPPDEESALAASVAMARLLRLAGLNLDVTVDRLEDRLEIRLAGTDEERLRQLGVYFLDHVAQLLPRLVKALCGRQVLTRIDGGGLRSARELELQEMARAAAAKVLASGEAVVLEPLPPGERRVVHLTLADDPRLATESLGHGVEKPLRISPAGPPGLR